MERKEVALTKETRQGKFVKKILDAIGPQLSIKSSDKVAIKVNLSGSREIYANTHYETVESLIIYLRENYGIKDITVVEGSDGAFYTRRSTWDIFYKFRYKEVELMGVKLQDLDALPHEKTFEVETLLGKREVHYAEFDADYTIAVVPPKTHHLFPCILSIPGQAGYVKAEERGLLFGGILSDIKKLKIPDEQRFAKQLDMAGRNFAQLLKHISPSLVVADGLYGMEGKGPIKGSPVFHGFAIASEDPVLADSLAAYVMGFEADDIPYIYHSYKEGLGNNRWQNVIGVDPVKVKFPYRPHPNFQKQKLWRSKILGDKNGGREQEKKPFRKDGRHFERKNKTS